MICKDCLEDVEKLTRHGICKKCYSRYQNMKYNHKAYIPLKDLPEEERQKLLELRVRKSKEGAERKAKNQAKKETRAGNNEKENAEQQYQDFVNTIAKGDLKLYQQILQLLNIYEDKVREEVDEDISKEYTRRGISLKAEDYIPLDLAFETLWCVCNEDNYLTEYSKAEMALTDLVNDFQHQNENSSLEDLRSFIITGIRENQALRRRRPVKDIVDQMSCTKDLREYIQSDKKLMDLINDTRIALKNTINKQEHPMYRSKASEIILNTGNVLPEKKAFKQRWDVSVPCHNLFGNKNLDIFRLNGGALAYDEEGAKDILREILKTKFPNVTYKDNDIKAVPMELAQKEGA